MKNSPKTEKDILFSLWSCLLLTFTLFIFTPLDLFYHNIDVFWFTVNDILPLTIGVFIVSFLLLFGFAYLLKNKVRIFYLSTLWTMGFTFYIQGTFLAINYGPMDGRGINWNQYMVWGFINLFIWLVMFLLPFAIKKISKENYRKILTAIALIIVLMQCVSLSVSLLSANEQEHRIIVSNEGMFDISENNNIIIFVLDSFSASFFDELIERYCQYKDLFRDFMYFPNAVSGGATTPFGLPMLMTGLYYNGEGRREYIIRVFRETDLYRDLKSHNFDTRIYTEPSLLSHNLISIVDNIHTGQASVNSYIGLLGSLYEFVAFRTVPHFVKPFFVIYTGQFNRFMGANENLNPFVIDDPLFFANLNENGLNVVNNINIFRLFHLRGIHFPRNMNEHAYQVDATETDIWRQARGAFYIIETYIQMLKNVELYDNTTIIVTADHGHIVNEYDSWQADVFQNPVLLIKQANQRQEAMTVNRAPVSFTEMPATIASAFMSEYAKFGCTLFCIDELMPRIRRHFIYYAFASIFTGIHFPRGSVIEFEIGNDARNLDTIRKIGVITPETSVATYQLGSIVRVRYSIYRGFGTVQQEGVWTWDNLVEMRLRLEEPIMKDVEYELWYLHILGSQQRVRLHINNHFIGEVLATSDQQSIHFLIPQHVFYDEYVNIILELPDAFEPEWALHNAILGLYVTYFQLRPIHIINDVNK